jgi:hypothetical protein
MKCLIIHYFLLVMFNNKNNNNLQSGIILNNEAIMLKSFIQFLAWQAHIFQNFQQFQKVID